MARVIAANSDGIAQAAELLRAGQLVAFATETVYGLGADASNPQAVARIFAAKGRPADHPVIVHVHGAEALANWARHVPEAAWALAQAFWPGPLTLILPRAPGVPDGVTGGQDSVGLRCPSHPVARALLAQFGGAIAAPSANKFGRISPTSAAHVAADYAGEDLLILDGGAAEVGVESTIVDLSRLEAGHGIALLRPGAISADQIAAVTGIRPLAPDAAAPRTSGTLASHYAPNKPLRLMSADQIVDLSPQERSRSALLAFQVPDAQSWAWACQAPNAPGAYGHGLYAWLRAMDGSSASRLIVESVPDGLGWSAIIDRLARAAHHDA